MRQRKNLFLQMDIFSRFHNQRDFAHRLDISEDRLSKIINRHARATDEEINRIERAMASSRAEPFVGFETRRELADIYGEWSCLIYRDYLADVGYGAQIEIMHRLWKIVLMSAGINPTAIDELTGDVEDLEYLTDSERSRVKA